MKKIIAIIAAVVLLASCKAKQTVVAEQSAEELKASKEIVSGHLKNMPAFKTLNIRASARYEDNKQSQNVSADIRIKKDEIILVSVKVLGITMAKALITPTRVSYYEKLGGRYFDGDYELLSRWLGTELDFNKVQNMLLGRAMDNLEKGSYKATLEDGLHKLSSSKGNITKDFFFESAQYLLKRQVVVQAGSESRSVDINYPAHTTHRNGALPSKIDIAAQQKDKVNIELQYNNVTFDEDLSYPYDIPKDYERISIDAP